MNRKSKEALQIELEACRENAEKYFSITLNEIRLDQQIADIIAHKVEDYFHQRFRDWNVHDLLAFREVLRPAVQVAINHKRGRKKKIQLPEAHVEEEELQ